MLYIPCFVFALVFLLALLCATAQQSYCRHVGVRRPSVCRPSVKPVFSEPVRHINAKFGGKVPFHHISRPFLDLLDSVSRSHEIELRPSSVVRPSVRPSSVVRPSVASIISEVIAWISFKF